jgi:hypothetical protein
MFNFFDVDQNSEDWFELKKGKLGASSFCAVMANYGKCFGEPAKSLALKLALEICTGKRQENGFSNAYTERGHELEPFARMEYENQYFVSVKNGGYFDCGQYGCSPDGLVDDDGLIEIKSVIPSVHYATLNRCSFDPSYKWQLLGNLYCTGRVWIDFVSYCPEFTENKQLLVYRIYRSEYSEDIEKLQIGKIDE